MYRLLLLLLCCPIWSNAQSDVLEEEIEVDIRELAVKEAIRMIEKAASVRVVYASSLLPEPERTVTLTIHPQTVAAALQAVFQGQKLRMEVIGRRIHLRADDSGEASTFSLSGYVRDAGSGEALVGATVQIMDLANTGAVTNAYGYFSLSLRQGSYRVFSSYLGYEPVEVGIDLGTDQRLTIALKDYENQLDEVVVVGSVETPFSRPTQMGAHRIAVQEWKNLPAIGGEPDVLKMVQLLPGVKSAGEGSSGMYVRGGNLDQNLILLDEAPIYNPSHLLGFFSVFNTDAVRHAELYKGNIPVQYGGRLSSVLDLRMREGNRERLGVQGSVGTLASRILLDGPLSESASFMVSARRTYPDLFLKLLPDNGCNKLHFYDLNGKVNVRMNENNHFFLSGYYGRDAFRFFDKYENTWGNGTATLRWNHLFTEDLFSNFSLIYSQYNYYIDHLSDGQQSFYYSETEPGRYRTDSMQGVPGRSYTLTIQWEGITYTATDSMGAVPDPFEPVSFTYELGVRQFEYRRHQFGFAHPNQWQLTVHRADTSTVPPVEEPYYGQQVGQVILPPGDTRFTFFTHTNIEVSGLMNFEDAHFYGFRPGRWVTQKRFSLSPAYYDYLRGVFLETEWRESLFAGTPANPRGNVSQGALGFFSASAVRTERFWLD